MKYFFHIVPNVLIRIPFILTDSLHGSVQLMVYMVLFNLKTGTQISSSSSSIGTTTLGRFGLALRFHSTIFYLYTSLSSFSLSSSLNPLLLGQAISVLVFLLVLMSMVPIQLLFLTVLVVSILITCATHRNLCDFINWVS